MCFLVQNIIAILEHSERAGWEWTYIGVVDGEKVLEREARSLILIQRRKYLDKCFLLLPLLQPINQKPSVTRESELTIVC